MYEFGILKHSASFGIIIALLCKFLSCDAPLSVNKTILTFYLKYFQIHRNQTFFASAGILYETIQNSLDDYI